MPISIKDDDVKHLADELQALGGGKNRTDTIKRALIAQIEAMRRRTSLIGRISGLQDRATALADQKAT